MVPAPGVHPSDAVIMAFGQGRLPPNEAALLEEHFAHCAQCGHKLGQVGQDTFSELLREPSPAVAGADTLMAPAAPGALADIPPPLRDHGRYAVVRKLGSGGMGVVYQAVHRIMQRPVALKVIRPDLLATPLAVSRFRREAQAAARLAHPNIVTAYDADEAAGVHFFVMEYLEGRSLDQLVQERGPLPVPLACTLARQAALGLAHAHAQGMIHRDIKPANLMITAAGQVKILDFGLASWTESEDGRPRAAITQVGARLGTVMFAAPEQLASADRADARADQYGLGATLFFLLTGKPPPSADPTTTPEQAAPLHQLPASIPAEVRAIVSRLLAYLPQDRFASVAAAAAALQPWCENPSALSSPPLASPQIPPNGRKRRWLLAGGLLAGGALLVALGLFLLNRGTMPPPAGLPVLFVLPSHGLWYEDFHPAREVLEKAGHKILVATPGGSPAQLHDTSMVGKANRPATVPAGIDLKNVQEHQFAALVCVGYEHTEFTGDDTAAKAKVMRLLQVARHAELPVLGICRGQAVLGTAGLLQGKKVARQSENVDDLSAMGAVPQPERGVVVDGTLITASTERDAAAAATELTRLLRPNH